MLKKYIYIAVKPLVLYDEMNKERKKEETKQNKTKNTAVLSNRLQS